MDAYLYFEFIKKDLVKHINIESPEMNVILCINSRFFNKG